MRAISVLVIPPGKDWRTPRIYRDVASSDDVLNPDHSIRMDRGEVFNESEHDSGDFTLGMNCGHPESNRACLDRFIANQ